ncbi:MAG: iron complex transport system ATP-binding protein, partial [Hyphomonadaceae bacterium]
LEIQHLRKRKIEAISGGELALVLLARVLAGKPKYIFADEPLNHLDVAHQIQLIKALQVFCKNGGAVFAIVHDLTMAARLGNKFALMANGKIVANGDRQVLNTQNLSEIFGVEIATAKFNGQTIFVPK